MRALVLRNVPVLVVLVLGIVAIRTYWTHPLWLKANVHQSVAYGLALFGGGFTLFALLQFAWQRSRDWGTARAEGTVVGYRTGAPEDDSPSSARLHHPVVRFQAADGRHVTFTSALGGDPPPFQVGAPVMVTYRIREPERASIVTPGISWLLPAATLIVGLVLLAALAADLIRH